jgi:hypothetical protein
MKSALLALLVLAAGACASASGSGQPDADPNRPDADPTAPDADPTAPDADPVAIDAAPADARVLDGEWEPLVTSGWTLAPGQEGYLCASKTLTETVYVGAIRPLSPPGTHHTTVSLTSGGGADNPGSPCGPMFGDFYASGVGTSELVMPAGVGLVAEKGQKVLLNLHLFNAGDTPLSGTSGIEVILVPVDEVEHPARVSFYGPADFEIPSNGQVIPWSGENTLPSNATVFAIFPHMHQLGVHFTAEVVRGGATLPQPLWDDAYQFESQEFALIPPVAFQPGDKIRTTCQWVNNTGASVHWGDSSKAEMCFSVLMTY